MTNHTRNDILSSDLDFTFYFTFPFYSGRGWVGEKKLLLATKLHSYCQQELKWIETSGPGHQLRCVYCCCCPGGSMRDGQAGSLRLRCSSALAPPLNVCPCGPPRNLAVRSSGNPQLIEFNVSVYSRHSDHFKLSYCGLASLRLRIPH